MFTGSASWRTATLPRLCSILGSSSFASLGAVVMPPEGGASVRADINDMGKVDQESVVVWPFMGRSFRWVVPVATILALGGGSSAGFIHPN